MIPTAKGLNFIDTKYDDVHVLKKTDRGQKWLMTRPIGNSVKRFMSYHCME